MERLLTLALALCLAPSAAWLPAQRRMPRTSRGPRSMTMQLGDDHVHVSRRQALGPMGALLGIALVAPTTTRAEEEGSAAPPPPPPPPPPPAAPAADVVAIADAPADALPAPPVEAALAPPAPPVETAAAPPASVAAPASTPPEGLAALGRELGYYSGPRMDEETGEVASADAAKEGAFTETWGKRFPISDFRFK